MRHRTLALLPLTLPAALSLPVLGIGCSDQSLGRFNNPPEAAITSHATGDEALEGYTVTLRGSASDPDDSADSLDVTWYLGDQVACPTAAPDEDGLTTCSLAPEPGLDKVTLEVRDPDNATVSDSITLSVVPTEAPVAAIAEPVEDGRYYTDQKLTFQGRVSDAEDDADDLQLVWKSDLDGELDLDGGPDSSGLMTSSGYLSVGQHAITLTVTDLSGKTGADQVIIDVGEPNRVPTCSFTAPADGGRSQAGEAVLFEATASDPDQPADTLDFSLSSNLDASLASGNPASDGAIVLTLDTLGQGAHVLTLTVTDELDETCTDTISWTVGNPPSVVIEEPASGTRVDQGDRVVFVATVGDDADPPDTLVLDWSSSLDGSFSTAGADSSGTATASTSSLSAGLHLVTLTVTDSDGARATDTLNLTVNQAPSAPVVSISPADPLTDDDLGVVVDTDAVDPEGDPLTYRYAWFRNGVEATAWTGTEVSASATSKGETWRVEVSADDGSAEGPAGAAEVTVGNTTPSVDGVSLSPGTVYTDDTVTASVSGSDADGDSLSYSYSWTVNGAGISATSSSLSGSTWFDKGDEIAVTVTPSDGDDAGSAVSSDSLVVQNSPPEITAVSLSPSSVGTDDTLTASVSGRDDDGDTITYRYAWTVNGVSAGSDSSSLSGATWFDSGDEVQVTVTPDDGEDVGDAVSSATVTVGGGVPVISSVTLSPTTLTTNTTVSASVTASDPDGDSITLAYDWRVNGSSVGVTSSSLSGSSWFDKGDDVQVRVTPSDVDGSGSPVDSDTLTVQNSAPSVSSVTLSPSAVYTDDTITASVSGSDADGDSLSYSYSWTVDGVDAGGDSSSLSGSAWFDKHDEVQVTVTPSDGEEAGASRSSSVLTVRNSPPTAPVVAISPADPFEGEALLCELDSPGSDADGDSLDYIFEWEVDGVGYGGATSTDWTDDTVPEDETLADEDWTCTVTADDGEATGGSDSDAVTIASGDSDYNGIWDLDSAISYSCALGYVAVSFDSWYIEDMYPDVDITSISSAQPGTMSGTFPTATTVAASRVLTGTCTETYQVSGTFTDSDTFEGTLDLTFTGGLYCLDCSTRSYEFTARR